MTSRATGRQRGRPPYPLLTPAEERVLEFVRQGKTNAEIGGRLGVSPDAVKYHVSNLLGKSGLSSREELAGWRPRPGNILTRAWGAIPLLGKLAVGATAVVAGGAITWSAVHHSTAATPLRDGLVTLGYDGKPANDTSSNPKLSADGRYVVFESRASNLVPNDTNNASDIFRYDRETGVMEMVSSYQSTGGSIDPSVSADGNFIAYSQWSTLWPGHTANAVLVQDIRGHRLVAVDSPDASTAAVSPDGRYLAYVRNETSEALYPKGSILVRELSTGAEVASLPLDREADPIAHPGLRFSPDGRWLAFPAGQVAGVQCETVWMDAYINTVRRRVPIPRPFVYDMQTGRTSCAPLNFGSGESTVREASDGATADGQVAYLVSLGEPWEAGQSEADPFRLTGALLVLWKPETGEVLAEGISDEPFFGWTGGAALANGLLARPNFQHSGGITLTDLSGRVTSTISAHPTRFDSTPLQHWQPTLSADGHSLAYVVSGIDTTSGSHVGDIYVTTLK